MRISTKAEWIAAALAAATISAPIAHATDGGLLDRASRQRTERRVNLSTVNQPPPKVVIPAWMTDIH